MDVRNKDRASRLAPWTPLVALSFGGIVLGVFLSSSWSQLFGWKLAGAFRISGPGAWLFGL